jgi:hypothetical protein
MPLPRPLAPVSMSWSTADLLLGVSVARFGPVVMATPRSRVGTTWDGLITGTVAEPGHGE